ncbi:MAG: phosphoribosylglycinamide formyltransferase [Balneolaceae bacterium]
MKKLTVFASGSGTNFQAIIDAVEQGELDATITGLITSRDQIGALARANKAVIPCSVIKPGHYRTEEGFAEALLEALQSFDPDLIVLAGYTVKIPASVIRKYAGRILNIHPSLLPRYGGKGFYGMRVHEAVLRAGDKETGCTVHLVDEEYDRGPILAQRKVPVYNGDSPETLARRVLKQEHQILPLTIQQLLTDQTN